jgi:hypothetical protein
MQRIVWILLAATADEDCPKVIRKHCRVGSTVDLRRESDHPHDADVLAAWLHCSSLFGLLRCWKKIGYVKATPTDRWAARLDEGSLRVHRAVVSDCHTANAWEVPRVSLQIEFRHA